MSTEERERRSRSRTARIEGQLSAGFSEHSPSSSTHLRKPSVANSPRKTRHFNIISDDPSEIGTTTQRENIIKATNESTLVSTNHKSANPIASDARSSSLSELEDGLDDNELEIRADLTSSIADDDSEAETERLDLTPRNGQRSSAYLAHVQHKNAPRSPDFGGRKRKRGDTGASSHNELERGEPALKKNTIDINNLSKETNILNASAVLDTVDPGDKFDDEPQDQSRHVPEDENDEERSVLLQPTKLERNRKKSVRSGEITEDRATTDATVGEDMVDLDGDEEDASSQDEDLIKKRVAIESLSKIEKKFRIFREKMCEEGITQLSKELEMLQRADCTHPEYIAMLQPLNERRDEKIDYENRILTYKENALQVRVVAERHQLHSQYFQTIRDMRSSFLSECNQRYFQLQRERRQICPDESDYSFSFKAQRSIQLQNQTAYNSEVSILSGFARYVGFPAAPDLSSARATEIDNDLRAMKVN